MTRHFSIPTVLRMAPNALLKELFTTMEYLELDRDWESLKEREIGPIQAAISRQPRELQGASKPNSGICLSWLATPESNRFSKRPRCLVMEPSSLNCRLTLAFITKCCGFGYTTWTCSRGRSRIHSFEVLSWWRKRNDLPAEQIHVDDRLRERLGEAIAVYLDGTQGRGLPCTVEHFGRDDGTEYFYAHPDDFAHQATAHDDNRKLTPVTIRTTFSIVFAYNSSEGSLEIHANISAKAKRQLEKVFCQIVFGEELGDWEPDAAYELNALKDRTFSLATDPEDRVRVQIRAMRLSGRNTGRRNTVEISDDDDNIHDAIDEWVNKRQVPLSEVNATKVTFRFEFLELDGRKPGSETFDVTWPCSCNLKGRRAERVAIIEKYLKRWKIDVSRTVVAGVGEAEPGPARPLRPSCASDLRM